MSVLLLAGVAIAVMGCIVNGPGEMADADFGYVDGAPLTVPLLLLLLLFCYLQAWQLQSWAAL
jgi:hypothetical protein